MKGKFITIEGPDGAGKTTQVPYLVKLLEEKGFEVMRTREPGGTYFAEKVRDLLLTEKMAPLSELLLFAAARADHVETLIKPALAAGKIVICDRFADSSYAYQGGGRGLSTEVEELERLVLRGFEPDYTLFFHITLEESMRRLFGRSEDINTFDAETRDFKRGVYNGYRKRFLQNPHRMIKIDSHRTVGEINETLKEWVNGPFMADMDISDVEKQELKLTAKVGG